MSSFAERLRVALTSLDGDRRFAAFAATGLLMTMFLPWYEKSVVIPGSRSFASDSISAFGAVSFVEAAIFLVSAGVLVLLLARAEQRTFQLPGGDGTVILAAGLWAAALIFYRVFDRPDVSGDAGTVGIQWGFLIAFAAAGTLAAAGQRIRAAARPEPPLRRRERPPARTPAADPPAAGAAAVPASEERTEVVPSTRPPRNRAVTRADAQQLTFDDPHGGRGDDPEAPDGDAPLPRGGEIPRARDRRR